MVGLQYCLPHPAFFVVMKHVLLLIEGDWTINDVVGNIVFKVSGRHVLYSTDRIIASSSTIRCNECDRSDGSMACT